MKKLLKFCAVITFVLAFGNATMAATLSVPGDFGTIQDAINDAVAGDTVIVEPGTYYENINFKGKSILVISRDGPETTIIDGGNTYSYPVVKFDSEESPSSIISGFTITNGRALDGGGIYIRNSSPTIIQNKIIGNNGGSGIGIAVLYASPIIERNIISDNIQIGSGGGGGGIWLAWSSGTQVLDNVISNNISGGGGGIDMFMAGEVVIRGNVISGNSVGGDGGGISMVNWSDALIVQNLIIGNSASQGDGIYWLVPSDCQGPFLLSNTIVGSNNPSGSVIHAEGYHDNGKLVNNIIVATLGQTAIFCGDMFPSTSLPPIIEYNDVFSPSGSAYGGVCEDQTGTNGNISADPLFFDSSNEDYHIQVDSPVIDAGDNAVSELPSTDFDGCVRVVDGDNDGLEVVDMGAFEFQTIPVGPINSLIESVNAMDLHKGTKNALLDKLNTALSKLEDDNESNDKAATNILYDFIQLVEAQQGKKIADQDAEELISAAIHIIALLQCV